MRLVLIDDHPLVLQGIEVVIQCQQDMEVVGTASCGEAGIKIVEDCQPDIALVDLRLPGEYGLNIIKEARKIAPRCRFIVLTSYSDRADVKRAMAEKVEGYVLKEALPEEIVNAIRLVGNQRTYIDPTIMQTLICQEKDDPLDQLTPREREVLEYLARGMSNREIAVELFLTEYTIKKHVSQILDKMGFNDRTQAALYAYAHGMGSPDNLTSLH